MQDSTSLFGAPKTREDALQILSILKLFSVTLGGIYLFFAAMMLVIGSPSEDMIGMIIVGSLFMAGGIGTGYTKSRPIAVLVFAYALTIFIVQTGLFNSSEPSENAASSSGLSLYLRLFMEIGVALTMWSLLRAMGAIAKLRGIFALDTLQATPPNGACPEHLGWVFWKYGFALTLILLIGSAQALKAFNFGVIKHGSWDPSFALKGRTELFLLFSLNAGYVFWWIKKLWRCPRTEWWYLAALVALTYLASFLSISALMLYLPWPPWRSVHT